MSCDADGAGELEQLDALVDAVRAGEVEVVIGRRTLGGAEPGAQSWPQIAGNRIAAPLLRLERIDPERGFARPMETRA